MSCTVLVGLEDTVWDVNFHVGTRSRAVRVRLLALCLTAFSCLENTVQNIILSLEHEQHDGGGIQPGAPDKFFNPHKFIHLMRNLAVSGANRDNRHARFVQECAVSRAGHATVPWFSVQG